MRIAFVERRWQSRGRPPKLSVCCRRIRGSGIIRNRRSMSLRSRLNAGAAVAALRVGSRSLHTQNRAHIVNKFRFRDFLLRLLPQVLHLPDAVGKLVVAGNQRHAEALAIRVL